MNPKVNRELLAYLRGSDFIRTAHVGRNWHSVAMVSCLFIVSLSSCARGNVAGTQVLAPEHIVEWGQDGFASLGCSADWIYGKSQSPPVLEILAWKGGSVAKYGKLHLASDPLDVAVLPEGRCIANDREGEEWSVKVRSLKTGETIYQWRNEKDWCIHLGRPSRNGEHLPVLATPDVGSPDYGDPKKTRIGTVSLRGDKVEWALTASMKSGWINKATASEDGAYVGIAGWENRTILVDVLGKKILWKQGLETDAKDIAFSPDNKTLYTGGVIGCVHAIDVKSGKILARWFATKSGKEDYGHRISTVSVSPDGQFVAAGTGPEGQVFLFSTNHGTLVGLLEHGGGTIRITHFSPDSKYLASYAAGKIKIWAVPR